MIKKLNIKRFKNKKLIKKDKMTGIGENSIQHAKHYYYVESNEHKDTSSWECRFIFLNKSEFPISLESINIKNDQETFLSLPNLSERVEPQSKYKSSAFNYKSSNRPKDIPKFNVSVNFSIIT